MRLALLLLMAVSACGFGLGATTAATRPLVGRKVVNQDATFTSFVRSDDQSGVPRGYERLEQVDEKYENFGKPMKYFCTGLMVRRGSATGTHDNVEEEATITEVEADACVKFLSPIGRLAIGGHYLIVSEGDASLRGLGVHASLAVIAQFSVDASYTSVHGDYDLDEIDGSRKSLGVTVMLYGINFFRLGVQLALTRTSTDDYESSGYTYNFVGSFF